MLGSIVFRASRIVATWSMFTLSFAGIVKIIYASSGVSTNLRQLGEHPAGVADDTDLRALCVVSTDRDLLQPQSVEMRDEKKLDVESEAVDRHHVEQRSEFPHVKCLEPALRIGERQSRQFSDDEVHDLSALLTAPRLVRADQTAVESSRSESHIAFS